MCAAAMGFVFFGAFVPVRLHYSIDVVLAYLSSPLVLGVLEFYFNELKEENEKEILLPLSLFSTGVSILIVTIYFISLGTNLDAHANAGFGMFPVTFAASVNTATLVVVLLPIVFSIVAVVKGFIIKKHN